MQKSSTTLNTPKITFSSVKNVGYHLELRGLIFLKLYSKFIEVSQIKFSDSFDSDKQS